MSLILDALRKIDREKSLRRMGSPDLALEVLKQDLPRMSRKIPLAFAALGLTAAAAAGITYAVLAGWEGKRNSSTPEKPLVSAQNTSVGAHRHAPLLSEKPGMAAQPQSPQQPAAPGASLKTASPAPAAMPRKPEPPKHLATDPPAAPPREAAKTAPPPTHPATDSPAAPPREAAKPGPPPRNAAVAAPQPLPPPPAAPPKSSLVSAPPLVPAQPPGPPAIPRDPVRDRRSEPAPGASKAQPPGESKTPRLEKRTIQPPAVERDPAKARPVQVPGSPPQLRVSAIMWFEEPAQRFAMINGLILHEGGMIEGAQVVEIKPASVRLLHNGQSFEISAQR